MWVIRVCVHPSPGTEQYLLRMPGPHDYVREIVIDNNIHGSCGVRVCVPHFVIGVSKAKNIIKTIFYSTVST